ncbi:MAG: hypothetical protein QOF78_3427 [Phycisphaerales bacterium]|nr:hypothetical protein [Phycisphaerales bacterium]
MPYVIFTANGEEYDRRELTRPMILGRAPDCDVAIPDITLSRHHCRLEPSENGRAWQLVDLHSKNGTHFLGQKIETHVFRDKDELRIGRTRLTFRAGEFVSSNKVKSRGVIRPSDPHEALAGTVTGMVLCEPGETETYEGMPVPQPRPTDPMSFEQDDIYGMINEIVSSSWDSVQAQASQPTRMQRAQPTPAVAPANPIRPKPRVSFALQAEHPEDGTGGAATSGRSAKRATKAKREAQPSAPSVTILPAKIAATVQTIRNWRRPRIPHKFVMAMASAVVAGLLFFGYVSLLLHLTRDPAPPVPRPMPESPAAIPDQRESSQPAAMIPFAEGTESVSSKPWNAVMSS